MSPTVTPKSYGPTLHTRPASLGVAVVGHGPGPTRTLRHLRVRRRPRFFLAKGLRLLHHHTPHKAGTDAQGRKVKTAAMSDVPVLR